MKKLAEMNESEKDLSRLVIKESVKEGGVFEPTDELEIIFRDIVLKGQQNHYFDPDVDLRMAGEIIKGLYFDTLFQWVGSESSFSLEHRLLSKLAIL